ncbi:MAG: hypothetical protein ACRERE_08065 [Candidatus Entotheonellia bacterium]
MGGESGAEVPRPAPVAAYPCDSGRGDKPDRVDADPLVTSDLEEMTPGIWVRHQALGELEEQARAELYEFAQ